MRYISTLISVYLLLTGSTIFMVTINHPAIAEDISWWDDSYDFRQKIQIPIKTMVPSSKNAPVDLSITFSEPCWAVNETHHSIRVIYQTNLSEVELESQIYNLNFSDDTTLHSCNLIFLVPETITEEGEFIVYYDDEIKNPPLYPDRVTVESSHYHYEPVTGYRFESWYYAVLQNDELIYTVAQEGDFMENSISQQISKIQPDTNTFSPQNIEQTASFALDYWYKKNNQWNKISTAEKLQSKEIIVDGNLMVKFGIVSSTSNDIFQTTAYYSYYYTPSENTRLQTQITHELIADSAPKGDAIDVFYGSISSGTFSSAIYKDLNFGRLPSAIHVYTIENQSVEYTLSQNPDSTWEPVLGRKADLDLGSPGTCSLDFPTSSQSHAVIFSNNSVVETGTDEPDGIEIQVYQEKVNKPGVSSTSSYIFFSRNTYEPETGKDTAIPNEYRIHFNAEFFSVQTGGYQAVSSEANLYTQLIDLKPVEEADISGHGSEKGTLSLAVTAYLTPGLSIEYFASKIGFSSPAIIAELYLNETLYASSVCSRIETTNGSRINWENSTIFLNTRFFHLPNGNYVLKIFFKNSLFSKNNRYIGVGTIDLRTNETVQILCRQQGSVKLRITDQDNNGLSHVNTDLYLNNLVISTAVSNENGESWLYAPCSLLDYDYTLQTHYHGFIIDSTQINLGYTRSVIPLEISQVYQVYDVSFTILHANSSPYQSLATIELISDSMDYPNTLTSSTNNGIYTFDRVPPAHYKMTLLYDSFIVQKQIDIQNTTDQTIQLRDLSIILKDTWNLSPAVPIDIYVSNSEFIIEHKLSPEKKNQSVFLFSDLYTGIYNLSIRYKSFLTSAQYDLTNDIILQDTLLFPAAYNVSVSLYDSHGIAITDADLVIQRNQTRKHLKINEEGLIRISVPPGLYYLRASDGSETIGKRKLTITYPKSISLVTSKEPNHPIIIWLITGISIVFAAILFIRKNKQIPLFILLLSMAILVSTVILPWWSLDGTDQQVEQSTTIYLFPHSFISYTETPTVQAGEIITPTEEISRSMIYIEILVIFSGLSLLATILLSHYQMSKTMMFMSFLALILLIISLLLFYSTMSIYAEASIGDIHGSGLINSNIPGEDNSITLDSSWGLSGGFYGGMVAIFLIVLFQLQTVVQRDFIHRIHLFIKRIIHR